MCLEGYQFQIRHHKQLTKWGYRLETVSGKTIKCCVVAVKSLSVLHLSVVISFNYLP
jgi:hypothetical protein